MNFKRHITILRIVMYSLDTVIALSLLYYFGSKIFPYEFIALGDQFYYLSIILILEAIILTAEKVKEDLEDMPVGKWRRYRI